MQDFFHQQYHPLHRFFPFLCFFPSKSPDFSQDSFQKTTSKSPEKYPWKNSDEKKLTPLEVDVETLSQGFKDPLDHDFQSSQAPWNHIKNPVILAFVHYLHFVEVVYSRRWSGRTKTLWYWGSKGGRDDKILLLHEELKNPRILNITE